MPFQPHFLSSRALSPAQHPSQSPPFCLPFQGRIAEKCLKFLAAAGLEYDRPDRVDVALVHNMPITILFLPAADIAQYVGEGNVDLGITGEAGRKAGPSALFRRVPPARRAKEGTGHRPLRNELAKARSSTWRAGARATPPPT